MSMAFEIADEDIVAAASSLGCEMTYDEAEAIRGRLDLAKIERAALYGDDIDVQTKYAIDAIAGQLVELGIVAPSTDALRR